MELPTFLRKDKSPGPGWQKVEDDGSIWIACPRCGWWIRLTPEQALRKVIIDCNRCHQWNDYLPWGGTINPFHYSPLPDAQHKEISGRKR